MLEMYYPAISLTSDITANSWDMNSPIYKFEEYIPLSLFRFRYGGLNSSILQVIINQGVDIENSILGGKNIVEFSPVLNLALQRYYGRLSTRNRMKFNTEFYECMNEVLKDIMPKSQNFIISSVHNGNRTIYAEHLINSADLNTSCSALNFDERNDTQRITGDFHFLSTHHENNSLKCPMIMTIRAEYVTQFIGLFTTSLWSRGSRCAPKMLPNPKWFKLFANISALSPASTSYRIVHHKLNICELSGIECNVIQDNNLSSIFEIILQPPPSIHEVIGGNLMNREENTTKFVRELYSAS